MTAANAFYQRTFFADLSGNPLEGGQVYLGVANQDPITHPISAYWDSALTVPASQPLSVTAGYITNSGVRAAVYLSTGLYSMTILDKSGAQVDYVAQASDALYQVAGPDGASLVGYVLNLSGAIARTVADWFYDRPSIMDFIPAVERVKIRLRTSSADLSPYFAAAVSAVGSGTIDIPAGTYNLAAAATVSSGSIKWQGAGRSATLVNATNTTMNVFAFSGTAFDCSLEDMTISATVTQTAGAGVMQTNGTGNIRINNVRIQNCYNGVAQSNSSVSGVLSLSNVDISTTQNDGIRIGGNSQFFADNVSVYGNIAGSNLHIISASGVYIVNSTFQSSGGFGVSLVTGASSPIYDCYFTNVEIDASANSGFVADSSAGGAIYNVQFVNSRSGFSGGAGFATNGAQTTNFIVSSSSFYKNKNDGIDIINLQDSIIQGNQVLGNSASGAGWNGINIYGGTGLTIVGNRCGPYYATGNNQAYGIALESSFTGIARIADNDVRGNATAGLFNASTSTGVTVSGNAGYNPVGMSIITPSASPYTYTAGASREEIYIRGGSVSNVNLTAPNGTLAIFNVTSGCTLTLNPWESFQVTYSVAPTIIKNVA